MTKDIPRSVDEIAKGWWRALKAVESDSAPRLAQELKNCPEALHFHGSLDSGSLTLLQVAAMRDKPHCLRLLAEAGGNVHEQLHWEDGCEHQASTPMTQAIYCFERGIRTGMFNALMAGAPPGVGVHAEEWKMAMGAAVFQEDCMMMRAINAHCGEEGKALWPSIGFREDAESLFHLAASSAEHCVEIVRLLLSWEGMEAVMDRPNEEGIAPRGIAKTCENAEFIKEVEAWKSMRREAKELSDLIGVPPTGLRKSSDGPRL